MWAEKRGGVYVVHFSYCDDIRSFPKERDALACMNRPVEFLRDLYEESRRLHGQD